MNDSPLNQSSHILASLAARILGHNLKDEKLWKDAFAKSKKFLDQAAIEAEGFAPQASANEQGYPLNEEGGRISLSDNSRSASDYVKIGDLIRQRAIGRIQDVDSLLKNRIRPRIPSRKEVATARQHFHPTPEADIMAIALDAAAKATRTKTRYPAIVLNLLDRPLDYESIQESMTLQWSSDPPLWLVERPLIEPISPPSLADLSHQVNAFLGEFAHNLRQAAGY